MTMFTVIKLTDFEIWWDNETMPDLLRVWNIRTAVTGVSDAITIAIYLVRIGNCLAVVLGIEYS